MCLIIDANVAQKFTEPAHDDVKPVVAWLLDPRHLRHVVNGGRLRQELERAGDAIRRFLINLKRAGRLLEKADTEVDEEEIKVAKQAAEDGLDNFDDPHIIALARVSGARLLISRDRSSGLHAAFKKRRFLNPPGKIYQSSRHKRLLNRALPCK